MRFPVSRFGNTRTAAVLSTLAVLPAVAGVLLLVASFLSMILSLPPSVGLAGVFAATLLLAPAAYIEVLSVTATAPWPALVRAWVLRPAICVCFIVSGVLAGLATYFGYVWSAVLWGRLWTYVELVLILFGMILVTAAETLALAFGFDVVRSTVRRLRGWNRSIIDGWSEAEKLARCLILSCPLVADGPTLELKV